MKLLEIIPTGCGRLDEILDGGLPLSSVSLIYGEAETAKTTLAMQCAVNCARGGAKVLFVDCDGTFSPRRLSQIASEDVEKIAEHIVLARPKDFREQATLIDQLANYLTKDFSLAVFDTITHFYRLEVAEKPEKTFELNRELNRQLAWLAQIAKTHKIAVLIVSQVRSVFENTQVAVEPVATRVLKFWADVIIALKPTEKPKIVEAVVEKKGAKKQPISCLMKISLTGLSEHIT
ncbi:MAG: AAA family ATPase [Candidatus Bathyarchaeia archaeon]